MTQPFNLLIMGCAAIAALSLATAADAATFRFDAAPFAGTTALQTPGRQVIGNELFIPVFDIANDVVTFDPQAFGLTAEVSFFNGVASGIPAGANVIVLEDFDGDLNPGNGILLNAGLAANLIANSVTTPGAGFFIYFNSGLDLPRLVFSTDLDSSAADLKIVARFTGLSGQPGRDAMPTFTGTNVTAIPEPATWGLMIGGFAFVGATLRRRRVVAAII